MTDSWLRDGVVVPVARQAGAGGVGDGGEVEADAILRRVVLDGDGGGGVGLVVGQVADGQPAGVDGDRVGAALLILEIDVRADLVVPERHLGDGGKKPPGLKLLDTHAKQIAGTHGSATLENFGRMGNGMAAEAPDPGNMGQIGRPRKVRPGGGRA